MATQAAVSESVPAASSAPLSSQAEVPNTAAASTTMKPARPLPTLCYYCNERKPKLQRPKTGCKVCKECFLYRFEEEIHETIQNGKLFKRGERVVIGASGGKDSTVLAHVMTLLNKRHDYGLDLVLLSVDEGISGYRDDSLETVKRNQQQYGIPLKIVSYKELYGWTMDEIVKAVGHKNNCTICGVFRRQALDRGALLLKADKVLTGHNCDDIAETVIINILRGDIARLGRCVDIVTGRNSKLPRAKPFKFTYEKEIVMYAHFQQLDYFSTECKYAPFAFRGFAREYLKDLERANPRALLDIVHSAEHFHVGTENAEAPPPAGTCATCGFMSSQKMCKACALLMGLNSGRPDTVVGSGAKVRRMGKGGSSSSNNNNNSRSNKGMGGGGGSGGGKKEAENGSGVEETKQQSANGKSKPKEKECCGGGGGGCSTKATGALSTSGGGGGGGGCGGGALGVDEDYDAYDDADSVGNNSNSSRSCCGSSDGGCDAPSSSSSLSSSCGCASTTGLSPSSTSTTKQQQGSGGAPKGALAADDSDLLARLLAAGLAVKEGETAAQANQRLKKEAKYLLKQQAWAAKNQRQQEDQQQQQQQRQGEEGG